MVRRGDALPTIRLSILSRRRCQRGPRRL